MNALTFVITLEEPFLATQVNNGEPNSGVSYPFIPGSMIRGALIRHYLNGQEADLAADARGRELFLSGRVRYLNAYPYDAGQMARLLPTPRSWFVEKGQEKDAGAAIADFAVRPNRERGDAALETPKSVSTPFVTLIEGRPLLHTPVYQVTVHNTTDEPGKKKEGVSQMYRYEALAPSQQFQGVILADDDVVIDDLETWLEEATLVLGGSSTGGYGLVSVGDIDLEPNWQEAPAEAPPADSHILTCLSDVIVRDGTGQVSAAMAAALGLDPADVTAFQRVRVVGGFNQKWGLPLPQSWAIQAGSVFRIRRDAVSAEALADRTAAGIGERTVEGFGRVALNWHTHPERTRHVAGETQAAGPVPVTGYGRDLAQQMANRRLQQQLETALQQQIRRYRGSFRSLPSATQLSRVRLAARHALARRDLAGIARHMDSLTGARSQWQNSRIGGGDLAAWIKDHSRMDAGLFAERFGIAGRLPQMAGVEAELTDDLRTEYGARLIDGVMKLAVEKKKADNKQEGA